MQQRRVGRSGLKVSVLGLGCNNFGGRSDREASISVIAAALDLGITLFDTAAAYPVPDPGRSELILGEGLGARRADIVLATKFGRDFAGGEGAWDGSRRHIVAAAEASLKRLGTDWIDLYYYHTLDPGTPIEETLRALEDLITSGKVRYIGCSNFPAWRTVEAHWIARSIGTNAFICAQEQYSLLNRQVEREAIPALEACGMGLIPYYPLASGLLTGKYRTGAPMPEGARLAVDKRTAKRFINERNLAFADRYARLCEERGLDPSALAIAWLIDRKAVPSVIAGVTRAGQLRANAAALDIRMTDDLRAALEGLDADPPVS